MSIFVLSVTFYRRGKTRTVTILPILVEGTRKARIISARRRGKAAPRTKRTLAERGRIGERAVGEATKTAGAFESRKS